MRKSKSDKLFVKLDTAIDKLSEKYGISTTLLYNLTDAARQAERASIAETLND